MDNETNQPAPDSDRYSLTVSWYECDCDAPTEFHLGEVDRMAQLALDKGLLFESITSDCPDIGLLFERLGPLGIPDYDEMKVNGITTAPAFTPDGRTALVPSGAGEPGVDYLDCGSSHWDTIGPCSMDQYEDLLRIGDLYWVHTSGDVESQRVSVGRFSDPEEGFRACVAASCFFSFDEAGNAVCELNSWPSSDDEEADEADTGSDIDETATEA